MHPRRALQFRTSRKAYAARLPKGKVIGKRWRILRKLGEGGFGAVYKVEEINTNEYVSFFFRDLLNASF
ncbi:hypothetical protein Y032_0018g3500 [Ancylostoma ceylanicum]|uniref:Protein kinase domain-containing protein n=1 Tax=Ancylostoma ceylanicum TaxID=53326 RepID=A0A016V4S0_9BILA|nr:hypothetical protein Y032_0018g3500 [Ancylostoma ceylanicum]